jgi:hypothetical protein
MTAEGRLLLLHQLRTNSGHAFERKQLAEEILMGWQSVWVGEIGWEMT